MPVNNFCLGEDNMMESIRAAYKSVIGSRPSQALLVAILACVPCLPQEPPPPVPKGPAKIARWVVEDVWNRGDFRLAETMFTPGMVLHFRGQNHPLTPEAGIGVVKAWRTAFPDFHFDLEDMIVEGNKVALRIPFTGTHQGKFWGLEPTGKVIHVTETLILRIEGGKIAEMWEDYDEYGMRLQLGLIKPD
jgi:predicted ester cyclase